MQREPNISSADPTSKPVGKRLLIASSSAIVRAGLAAIIEDHAWLRLGAVTDSTEATSRALRELRPAVVVIDAEWIELLRNAADGKAFAGRVLLLWRHTHRGLRPVSGMHKVCGLLRIQSDPAELRDALEVVAPCERSQANDMLCRACPVKQTLVPPDLPLTPREQELLSLVGQGHGNTAIAKKMNVTVKTVESYREDIKRKLELPSAAALLKTAVLWELGEMPGEASAVLGRLPALAGRS